MTEVHVHGPYATGRAAGLEDEVAVEEPLEIRVDGPRPAAPGPQFARGGHVNVYTGAERVR